jgi:methionine-rich copper-binding protein CopC
MKRCVSGGGKRRLPSFVTFVLVLLLGAPSAPVAAHALVIASQPGANTEVTAGEVGVDLQFNSRLDRKRARLRLIDASGAARDLALAPDDSPDHLRAAAGRLNPGAYRIEWYVLSPDGHVTRGNVPFVVRAERAPTAATP